LKEMLMVVCLLVTSAATSAAEEFYVSALSGSDSNAGTREQPFQSIQKCVDTLVPITYERIAGEMCKGGTSLGVLASEDLELCADLCRLSGFCDFFVLEASNNTFWCKTATACGSGSTKYRAMLSSEWAPSPRTCVVGEGSYYENVNIHHVKGSAESPVTIRAAPNSNVSLHGTVEVSGWTEHMRVPSPSGGEAVIWESAPLSQNIWQLWMQPLGQTKNVSRAQKRFEMMVPARWPNARFSDRTVFHREFWGKQRQSSSHGCSRDCSEHGCLKQSGFNSAADCTTAEARHGLLVDDGSEWRNLSIATWNGEPLNATGAIAVMNSGSWQTFQQVVTHHTPGSDRFAYTADFILSKFETNGYFLEGKKQFLDGPEEWWIDTSTKKVYLITDDGQNPGDTSREVRGKTTDYCITISHAAHLTIHGFHIFGCAIKSDPMYPYFAGPLTISSNELFFPGVTKRALGEPFTEKSPTMSWLYTWGRSNDDEQLPLTIFNNTWFGAEGTALNYRGKTTLDNNLFFNNDWTGVEGRDGNVGMAVIVGTGQVNTTVFTHNSMLYNGPSVTYSVDSAGALIQGNIVAGQGFGMIQNDGSHIQTMPARQNHTRIDSNWGFDSPKGSFRFDDSAQCFSNRSDCIGHFGSMTNNVDVGTRGIMVKGNNHVVLNNLAINAELRVYDKFKKNDCPHRCMNNFTTVRGNVGTALEIQRSIEVLDHAEGVKTYNSDVDLMMLRSLMPGYVFNDFRPLANTSIAGLGPYPPRIPTASAPSQYFIPGQKAYRTSHPIPPHDSKVDYRVTDVIFRPALNAVRHRVYLGCHKEAVSMAGIHAPCEKLRLMESVLEAPLNVQPIRNSILGACPVYYWRVDAELSDGVIVPGDAWEFRVSSMDSSMETQRLTPVDEGIANLQWGLDKTWAVGSSAFFTTNLVQLGGRPGNIEGVHFEYFVKFRIENLQGARLRNATLVMTKSAATLSDELRPAYTSGDEDDDLSAWAIPQTASSWSQRTLSRRFVQDEIQSAQQSLGILQNIGHTGYARYDVSSAITDIAGRVVQGEYSFRLSTGDRRRRNTREHFNSIFTTMNNKISPPQLLLDLEIPTAPQLTVLDLVPAGDETREAELSWPAHVPEPERTAIATRAILPQESARLAARQGNTAFGPGDAKNPVGLRSCDYPVKAKTPYEWLVKFDVSELQGQDLSSVFLSVSKCKSSQDCVDNCKSAKKCTCTGGNDGKKFCGGSSIDAPYDATSDDLHLWHVGNAWTSGYAYPDYKRSWDVTATQCNQDVLLNNQGALEFATYVASADSVGEKGRASFDITDLVRNAANGGDSILSFRFTVNGTAQRFYIPQGVAGGPSITATVKTSIKADARSYQVQKQSWDAQGIEPTGMFENLYNGSDLKAVVSVAHNSSALVRMRAVTQANMSGAVMVKSPWIYATLFRKSGVCPTTTTTTRVSTTLTTTTVTRTEATTTTTTTKLYTTTTTTAVTRTALRATTTTRTFTTRTTTFTSSLDKTGLEMDVRAGALAKGVGLLSFNFLLILCL